MRPELLNPLFVELTAVKGVGATLARQLGRLKLTRVVDLVWHLPVMAIDRVRLAALDAAYVDRTVTVEITPMTYEPGAMRRPFKVQCRDGAGTWLSLAYFGGGGAYAQKLLPLGSPRVVSGRLERFGEMLQIAHPDFVVAPADSATIPLREPVYGLTEGVTNKRMGALAAEAVSRAPDLAEWIEPSVLSRHAWRGWRDSVAAAHALDGPARDRLAYDELLANQLALLLVRADTRRRRGRALPGTGELTGRLLRCLPWPRTDAQRRVGAEIAGDLAQASPMLRLLQGDVGSGKTLVAALALLTAVESGAQGALLAPTEILARQHHATLAKLLEPTGVRIAVLTGRDKGVSRETYLAKLAAGEIDILIGTHAIFQDSVTYHDLGLVVIDEQHRFGVNQRLQLSAKARATPHLLAMTATPIPRTLALTSYGEMDVSAIDALPPGRTPVETRVIALERMGEVVDGLARHVASGGQAYWVCPLVEGNEYGGDEAAAETRAAFLRGRFGDGAVGLVHGRMKAADKDAVMAAFAGGDLPILVATTVIEVGVDVPAAALMIVEAAERFGLAQLHQLRGRVGRGAARSVCLLLRGSDLTETATARLKLMRETNDGFRIAEADLKLRGAGEILGTRQSGEPVFQLADPERMAKFLPVARDDARLLLDRDGGLDSPRGQAARHLLYLFERDAAVGLLRSG